MTQEVRLNTVASEVREYVETGQIPFQKEILLIKTLCKETITLRRSLHIALWELAEKLRNADINTIRFVEKHIPEVLGLYTRATVQTYLSTDPKLMRLKRQRQYDKELQLQLNNKWYIVSLSRKATILQEVDALTKLWGYTSEEAHEKFLGKILD